MKKILLIISMFMVFMIGYGKEKALDVNMEAGAKIPSFQLRDFSGKYTNSRYNSSRIKEINKKVEFRF